MDENVFRIDTQLSSKNSTRVQQAYIQGLEYQIPQVGNIKDIEESHVFSNLMEGYLEEVNTLQHDADAKIQRLVAGETEDLHEVMLAMDEAETSFELMMEIRNKLVNAYEELMRMQI
ncbi:MAG: flagellar hook-basal body complex protein FliE [Flavobacteriales bacterium]|jgi:flagellar hook-basal body complex protein FliE|nr:flagellar hook-basal body complex protein FliE [Flavobacteriales bacterium]